MNSNYQEKVVTWDKLREIVAARTGTAVFTNGCFDILHVGHIRCLCEAAKLGDFLIVGVNTDASVKRYKGESRPVNPCEERMEALAALEFVDYVVPFGQDTACELLDYIRPDILVKGGDYRVEQLPEARTVASNGGRTVIIPYVKGKSTTNIINTIHQLSK